MPDGLFAILTYAFLFWEMHSVHCETGCLARSEVTPRTAVSAGSVIFNGQDLGTEIYLRRDTGTQFGPFRLSYGLSATTEGSLWVGAGHTYTIPFAEGDGFVQLHMLAGLYEAGDGADLGGPIEFRSGIEIGYEADNGWRYGLSFDHRSNADIWPRNPGLETIQFRVSIPTR